MAFFAFKFDVKQQRNVGVNQTSPGLDTDPTVKDFQTQRANQAEINKEAS